MMLLSAAGKLLMDPLLGNETGMDVVGHNAEFNNLYFVSFSNFFENFFAKLFSFVFSKYLVNISCNDSRSKWYTACPT
jgi:hypothetical protein